MVQKENGMSARLNADRNAMPVMIPGSAIGKITNSDITSRPKNAVRETAAAHKVPSTSAITVEMEATFTESCSASQTSGRFQVTASHLAVKPGGGHC